MKKAVITLLICICLPKITVWSNPGSNYLTKDQMQEDFSYFYNHLQLVNPRLEIIKKVTGTDILGDLQKLYTCIDTISCESGFNDIMYRAITLCKDQHISFVEKYPYSDKDTSEINIAKKSTLELFNIFEKYNPNINPFQVYYINGDYFVPDIWDKEGILQIPAGSKLISINDIGVDEYVNKWIIPVFPNVRWDNVNKKFYVSTFISPQRLEQNNKFIVSYSFQGKIKEKELTSYRIKFPGNKGVYNPRVEYFIEDKILYIRIPYMDKGFIEDYNKEILKYKGATIDKVMIDIRDNNGGSDQVWMDILSVIIDKPIAAVQRLAFKDNPLVKEYLKKSNISYSNKELEKKSIYIGQDTLFCIREIREVNPMQKSLEYKGNIYVLANNRCFSSSLAFTSFCQSVDRLITVGSNYGYFGGQGITPFHFILPHSKFIFRLECSLDATGVQAYNPEEYYHDKVEIPVNINWDKTLLERDYEGDFYSEDYLYNIDPVFREVLKIDN